MSERLRVTFLTDRLVFGGAERHAVTVANGLDRARFDVSFVTLRPDGPLESLLATSELAQMGTAGVSRKLDFDAVARIAQFLDASDCEVVVAANPYATLYAVLAARRTKPRPAVVSTFHSTLMPGFKDQLQMLFYRFVFPLCDTLVYVSENQRRYWRRRALRGRRDRTIHNGIDMAHFSPADVGLDRAAARSALGYDEGCFVVGICAALRPEKAHADLLQVVATLGREGLPVRCLVIGDGPERPRLESLAERLGISRSVAITGYQMDVRSHVMACDALVLCSHSETFSLSALESMAMGRPMVMTRIGGASEQLVDGETGFLYEPGDLDALARHLRSLSRPGVAAEMGARAAEYVRRSFTLQKMLGEYASLFEGVARHPGGRSAASIR